MTFDTELEKKLLADQRLNDAIHQYQEAKERDEDTESLENRLDEINTLQKFIEQPERLTPQVIDWEDIPDIQSRDWLIESWLPANTVTMFTGDGGAGKSWLTLQMVCQVACGFRDAYLNPNFKKVADATLPRNVVFATWEDEPAEIKRRIQALAAENAYEWVKEHLSTIKKYLHIVDMRGIGSVWGPGIGQHIQNTGDLLSAGEDLRAICEDKKARLLVLDPLSGAFGGNENDRTAVYDFVSSFRGWGDKEECAMLVIGHLPKSAEGRTAGFSGSTAWEASARSMWKIGKHELQTETDKKTEKKTEKRHYWMLEHTKSNYAPLQSPICLTKDQMGWWTQADNPNEAADGYDAYQTGIQAKHTSTPNTQGGNNGTAAHLNNL